MTTASSRDALDAEEVRSLLTLATSLAEQAGELLVDGLTRSRSMVTTKSTSTDMVTEMDRASEKLIVDGIVVARPRDDILAEEGSARTGDSGFRWVVDPLDGTTNYLYAHPGFAVSIGVEHGGETVAAVVFDPLHRELFTAIRGEGAWRNGHPVTTSGEDRLSRALVATGFAYDPPRRARQAIVVAEVIGEIRDIRRMGAASVDLCSVACGRVDAYFERGLAPWDHAAGALVAAEAGAIVGGLDGGPATDEFCLATTPALFDGLRDLLVRAGAADA